MAEKILKSIKFPGLEDTYIIPESGSGNSNITNLKDGEYEKSLIGNDIDTNIVLGTNSTAMGSNNISGAKGFYIKNLDVTNKKIHLTTTECNPTFEENYSSDEVVDSTVDITGYEVGDYIDITAYTHYHWILCTKISEVGSDYIVYETDIDDPRNILTNIVDEETGEQKDVKYILSVPTKPWIGTVNFTSESFVEGSYNNAAGQYSHAEGYGVISTGRFSHAEGYGTISGYAAHAEGQSTKAIGLNSHAEGYLTESTGSTSHAEGYKTKSAGAYSHAEGSVTEANGRYAHSEGQSTKADGEASHSEGYGSDAFGMYSHAEGNDTTAQGNYSHSEGHLSKALNEAAHAEGYNTEAKGKRSHAEGRMTKAYGENSHAEGSSTEAYGVRSHAEGGSTKVYAADGHAEGSNTIAGTVNSTAKSQGAHVQGRYNLEDTEEKYAHIVGNGNSGGRSNAHTLDWAGNAWFDGDIYIKSYNHIGVDEGSKKIATEEYVNNQIENIEIPEEYATKTYVNSYRVIAGQKANTHLGSEATAEGHITTASGDYSHAEGNQSEATGAVSHAEGTLTKAIGKDSHAEGNRCEAKGQMSHAEGQGTIASDACFGQHVQGKYNIEDTAGEYAHIVGNGGSTARQNIHTLDWNGNAWFKGNIYIGGSAQNENSYRLPRIYSNNISPETYTEIYGDFGVDGDIYIMYEE